MGSGWGNKKKTHLGKGEETCFVVEDKHYNSGFAKTVGEMAVLAGVSM